MEPNHQSGAQQQSAGDISISGEDNASALVNAVGNATVDQSRQVIYNYNYYYQESKTVAVESAQPEDDLPCPYRGLFHFGPDDAEFFFGREVFVAELEQAVESRAFVPVLGASGSGKSSVVLAGLVPRLQQTGQWQFTHFRPGEDPFHALASALVPLYTPALNETKQMLQSRELATYLQDDRLPLADVVAQIQRNHPHQRVLLIADQFEELYTLCPDDTMRRQFLDCLLASLSVASSSSSPLVLIATMRADFLGNALSYRPFADVLQAQDVKLGVMNREELCDVIEQPVAKLEVGFEAGLVDRILKDVENEPGNLPLLEFALTELWKRRMGKTLTHGAYDAIGQVEGALARYADQKYGQLSESEKEQVRRIFIQLVRPGEGTEDTRRLATKEELGEERWALVKQLADTRLVVTSQDEAKQETVEVVHEALIRNWGELREWMVTDREFRSWQERLRGAMQQWEATNWDGGALLRGATLVEAEERLQARAEDVSPAGKIFIQRSFDLENRLNREREEQEQRELTAIKRLAKEETRARKAAQTTTRVMGIAFVSVLGFAVLSAYQWHQSLIGQIQALSQSSNAKFAVNRNSFDALIDALEAAESLKQISWLPKDPKLLSDTLTFLNQSLNWVRERNRLEGHTGFIQSVSFSPDGEIIATASYDKTVKLWNKDGDFIRDLEGFDDAVLSVDFSPDSQILATASRDGTLKIWSRNGSLIQDWRAHDGRINSIHFAPNGQIIATADNVGIVKLWKLDSTLLKQLSAHDGRAMSVRFSPNGQLLATGGNNGVKLWNWEDGSLLQSISEHTDAIADLSFSRDGRTLASASFDKSIILWNLDHRSETTVFATQNSSFVANHADAVTSISLSPDGNTLVSSSIDDTIKLWNLEGQLIDTLEGHDSRVNSTSFSPDGFLLVSSSNDKTAKLWQIKRKSLTISTGHEKSIYGVNINSDGSKLLSSSKDETVKIWDKNGNLSLDLNVGTSVTDASFSPDGNVVAIASNDPAIKLWTSDGNSYKDISGHTEKILSISYSVDGKSIVTSSADQTAKLWTSDGQLLQTFSGHKGWVYRARFSPDAKRIITSGEDRTAKVWDRNGKVLMTLTGHVGTVYRAVFSQDGEMIATSSEDNTVKLWDKNGNEIFTLLGHSAAIWGVAFSPDGHIIATASDDKTIKLWTKQGTLIATLIGHNDAVNDVKFSPDAKVLITASSDKKMILWNLDNLSLNYAIKSGCSWIKDYLKTHDESKILCHKK